MSLPTQIPMMKLPMLTNRSPIIGTAELQKLSSKSLESLAETGPRIVSIHGIKRAVLVDHDQYLHFQDVFKDVFKQMSVINTVLPKIHVPDGHRLKINELRLEISGTLQKIVEESPEASPFADLMDAILGVAAGLMEESQQAPMEMRKAAKNILNKSAKAVEARSGRPKRHSAE